MKLFVFVLVLIAVVAADQTWEKFKTSHGKDYGHPVVNALRKELFLKQDAVITKHNRENHSWKMGHSFLSDWTEEEKNQLLGAREPLDEEERNDLQSSFSLSAPLPSTVDYRKDSCMTPVKNQGSCGSCWTFSVINPLEFANCKRQKKLTALSEQQIVDCVYLGTNYPYGGCKGGWPKDAFKYLLGNGSAIASKYPYTATRGSCVYKPSMIGAQLSKFVAISNSNNAVRVQMMQDALVKNSTLSAVIFVNDDFGSYRSGVYISRTNCNYDVNHAVVIVGYGTQAGIDYWVVRNSWGAGWGDKGYILMQRGKNHCRIESDTYYVGVA